MYGGKKKGDHFQIIIMDKASKKTLKERIAGKLDPEMLRLFPEDGDRLVNLKLGISHRLSFLLSVRPQRVREIAKFTPRSRWFAAYSRRRFPTQTVIRRSHRRRRPMRGPRTWKA